MRDVQQASNARIEPADFTLLPSPISRLRHLECRRHQSAGGGAAQTGEQPLQHADVPVPP
jgi:hypothetical protein